MADTETTDATEQDSQNETAADQGPPSLAARALAMLLFAVTIACAIALVALVGLVGWVFYDSVMREGVLEGPAAFALILLAPALIVVGAVFCDITGRRMVRKAQELRRRPNFRLLESDH